MSHFDGVPILQPDAPPSGVVKVNATCGCGEIIPLKIPVQWFLEGHVETLLCPGCGVVWRQRYRVGVDVLGVERGDPANGNGNEG